MSDFLVSLDPSFTRTGICIVNLRSKEIFFETASCKIGEKQFENVVHAAKSVVQQIKEIISRICGENYTLISESPLPMSSMSSALYSLGTLIYTTFESHIAKTYNPATLRSKIHHHKYDKKDSLDLAEKYIKLLSEKGYIILSELGTKKKISHDCAESFLYIHLYLHDIGNPDFQFDNSDEVEKYKERIKLLKKKEKELLKSSDSLDVGVKL